MLGMDCNDLEESDIYFTAPRKLQASNTRGASRQQHISWAVLASLSFSSIKPML